MGEQDAPSMMIGSRRVSPDDPCFVIAEIGVNHNGDAGLAHALIDAAAEAGADAVKFQTFRAGELVVADASKARYQELQTGGGSQHDMLAALELTTAEFEQLRDHCADRGVVFMSTAFDVRSLEDVLALAPEVLKWPSGEIDNVLLLRQAAASRLPIILSTGMATMDEIAAALKTLDEAGSGPVAVLQCVSQYPAPMDEQNLRAIESMARAFHRVTGYSDHTEGIWAAIAARPLGMAILEKHLTLDRAMEGPDHRASIEPGAFADLVRALRAVESALGDGKKRPMPSELDTRDVARKSLVFARSLPEGHVLQAHDITAKRPGGGMSPAAIDSLIGRTLTRSAQADRQIAAADLA